MQHFSRGIYITMGFMRKFSSVLLALLLLLTPVQASAATMDVDDYAQLMIQYYLAYGEKADGEIEALLDNIEDPWLKEMWRGIMDSWEFHNYHMPVYQGILPDGLPEDDSLCIVIMGFGLNQNGSMKQELIDRLTVGLSSAQKYPNAYVAVTGGQTSGIKGVTEAGQMARWLSDNGISSNRLIVENSALRTTENAISVHKRLLENYPQGTSLAVVTSDYHIRQACTMFATVNHNAMATAGARQLELVGNGVNFTGRMSNTRYTEAWGISLITGIPFDKTADIPALFVTG